MWPVFHHHFLFLCCIFIIPMGRIWKVKGYGKPEKQTIRTTCICCKCLYNIWFICILTISQWSILLKYNALLSNRSFNRSNAAIFDKLSWCYVNIQHDKIKKTFKIFNSVERVFSKMWLQLMSKQITNFKAFLKIYWCLQYHLREWMFIMCFMLV